MNLYLLFLLFFGHSAAGQEDTNADAIKEVVGTFSEEKVEIYACSECSRMLNSEQRFRYTADPKILPVEGLKCESINDCTSCVNEAAEIKNDIGIVEIQPEGDILKRYVQNDFLRIFKCEAGMHFTSYDTIRTSQCIKGKWTPIYDKCIQDCKFPTACDHLAQFNLKDSHNDIYLFTSGKLDMYPSRIRCAGRWFLLAYNNGNSGLNQIETYTHDNDRKFIGMLSLKHFVTDHNGNPIPHEMKIIFKNGRQKRRAVYDSVTLLEDGTLKSIGSYHGTAGNMFCSFLGTKIESPSQFWGTNLELFSAFPKTKWGKYIDQWSMTIYMIKKSLIPEKWCPANIQIDETWHELTEVKFPDGRQPGEKVTYKCLGSISYDEVGKQDGVIECITTDNRISVWKENNLPCKLKCPNEFIASKTATYCVHYSEDTVENIYQASEKCIMKNSSLLYKETSMDLELAAENNKYYTGLQYGYNSEFISGQNYDLEIKADPELSEGEPACATIEKPNTMELDHCFYSNRDEGIKNVNYICKVPGVCPLGYELVNGACFKLHHTDTPITMVEALRKCVKEQGSLPFFANEKVGHATGDFIIDQMKKLDLENMIVPLGNNIRTEGKTVNGMYEYNPEMNHYITYPEDIAKHNVALKLYLDAPGNYKHEMLYVDLDFQSNYYICHYHGYTTCMFESPGEINGASKVGDFRPKDQVLSFFTYKCDRGYFIKDKIPMTEQKVECLGQLGGFHPKNVECIRDKVCEGKDPKNDANLQSLIDENESYYLDGEIIYKCPTGQKTEIGDTEQTFKCSWSEKEKTHMFMYETFTEVQICPACTITDLNDIEGKHLKETSPVVFTVGKTAVITCSEDSMNAKLGTKDQQILCTAAGWDTSSIQPCYKACEGEPIKGDDTKYIIREDFVTDSIDTKIKYFCIGTDYFIKQSEKNKDKNQETYVECLESGWLYEYGEESIQCVQMTSEDPKQPGDLMEYNWNGYLREYGTQVTYWCKNDHEVIFNSLKYNITVTAAETGWTPEISDENFACKTVCLGDPPPSGTNVKTKETLSSADRMVGNNYTYTCENNLYIVTTEEYPKPVQKTYATCKENAEWKLEKENIKLDCEEITLNNPRLAPKGGKSDWNEYTRSLQTPIKYTCDDTEEVILYNSENTLIVTATDNGWVPNDMTDDNFICAKICSDDPQPSGNNMKTKETLSSADRIVGKNYTYTCEDNMYIVTTEEYPEPVQNTYATCNENKDWKLEKENMKLDCEEICIDDPPEPENSDMVKTNTTLRNIHRSKVYYECSTGKYMQTVKDFTSILNQTYAECKDGKWIKEYPSRPLECVSICHEDIPKPKSEDITNNWNEYTRDPNTTVKYECPPSHLFIASKEPYVEIKCETDKWQAIDPTHLQCKKACLKEVPEEYNNANRVTPLDDNRFIGSEIEYMCEENMASKQGTNKAKISCNDGTWSDHYMEGTGFTEVNRVYINEENIFKCEPSCTEPPPRPTNGSEYNFTGDYRVGQVVHYKCNGLWFTVGVKEFSSVCLKDGDWTVPHIPDCVDATTTTKAPETVNPLLDAQFYADTNPIIIIENINQLNSSTDQPLNVTDTPVPFGTGITLNEEAKQCAKWDNFQNAQCVTNPRSCIDVGFSFSIWAKVYEVAEDNVEKRYLISTGGTTDGHPGVAIYVQADWLYSLVSIGEKYWLASAFLHVPNEQWSVIAVTLHNDDKGLITYIYKSDYREMKQLSQQSVPETAESKVGLSPPEIMFGCHKTSDNPEYRDFITADLDSFVVWQTPVVNEKWFTGGYSEENRTIEELVELLNNMEEQIPPDVSDAIVDLAMIMMQEEEKKEAELAETSSTSTEEIVSETSTDEMVDTDNIENLLIIIKQLINLINCPSEPKAESDIGNGVKPLELLSKSMDPSDSNVKKWKEVTNKDSANEFMNIFMQSVDFVHCNAISIQIEEDTFTYSFADKNLYTYVSKNKVDQLNRRDKVVIPSYNTELDDAHTDIARVAVWATRINDGRCENRTFTLTIQSAPTGFALHALIVNKRELNHNERLEIDSPVTGIRAETDPVYDENGVIDTSQPECGYGKLSGYKIDILIPHESKVPEIRSRNLLFFEESVHTEVIKRYCALWNKDIEKVGAWDISKCKIGETSSNHTRCLCAEDGLIVIIAHLKEKVEVPKDPAWLVKTQRALYIASAICIVIYAIVVLLSGDLKDQFHLAGLNLAIAIIMGHAAMYASEYEEIAENREACGWVSTAIYYFYLSVGTWIMALGHCCFKAITAGVISGKLHTYVCMAWGFSLTCLGLVMMFYLHDIGTDPRCFVAWEDEVKLTLLGPQAAFSLIAVFLTFVILCNLSTPALRKDNLIDDYGSFCKGAAFLMFVYGLTWIFAIFAYLRLDIDTDFYPIFTVLNSAMGVFLFLFIGLGSNRFRMVILGQAKTRRNMLKNYAFGLPGRSKPRPLK